MNNYFEPEMARDEILEAVDHIKNGTMARLKYTTELPLKAEFANLGYKVIKIVETTARFGVSYSNIARVAEKKSNSSVDTPYVKRNPNTSWIIKNKILHNSNTNKDYLVFAPMERGANNRTNFVVVDQYGNQFSLDYWVLPKDFKNMVQQKYWNDHKKFHDIKNVSLENVLRIGNKSTNS